MHTAGMLISAASIAMAAGTASAGVHQWDWSPGDPGSYAVSNNGGTISHIDATYNTMDNRLQWEVAFSDKLARGFTLAISDGPNPKGHPGQLALLYVDATDLDHVVVTAYAYNGLNTATSYKDGDGDTPGDQPGDIIHGVGDTSWIASAVVDNSGTGRVFSLDLDVSAINAHSPLYAGPDPWEGMRFGTGIGVWMHPFRSLDTEYSKKTGGLIEWSGPQGWFDGNDFETTRVPAPGPVALGGAAMGLALVRRRPRG